MKKAVSFALVALLMLSTASFAQSKKSAAKKAAPAAAKKTVAKKSSSELTVSPKVSLYTGNGGSSFAIGCEVAKPIMKNVDLMGEVIYVLPNGGVSNIIIGGNGIYKFDKVKGMPGDLYAGGGLTFNMFSGSGISASGVGFQGLAGMDIPAGDGTAFAQLKYASSNYSYSIPFFGTVSVNASGFVLEGGYRLAL